VSDNRIRAEHPHAGPADITLQTGMLTARSVLADPALWTAGNPCTVSTSEALPDCYTPSSCQVERLGQDNEFL